MTDPVSILLGVIPIGISICQGVTGYCKRYKNQDEELEKLCAATERLRRSLKYLDDILKSFSSIEKRQFASQAVSELDALTTGFERLQEKIKSFEKYDEPVNAREKLSNGWRKIRYPLDRSDLLSEVDEIQRLHSTAVQGIQLALQISQGLSIKRIASDSEEIKSRQVTIQANVEQVVAKLPEPSDSVKWNDVDARFSSVERLIQSLQVGSTSRPPEPSILRSACDEQQNFKSPLHHTGPLTTISYTLAKTAALTSSIKCICRNSGHSQKIQYSIGPISIFANFVTLHDASCPLYRLSDQTKTLGAKVNIYGRFVNICVLATMSITQGAGGMSISPNLSFRNIVHARSPAMELLNFTTVFQNDVLKSDISPDFLHGVMRQLEQLFLEGKASPTDVDTLGRSLLHQFFRLLGFINLKSPLYAHFWLDFRFYARRLIEIGAPYDNHSNSGASAVDELIWFTHPYYMSDDLIELCVDLSIDIFENKGTLPCFESPHRQLMDPANSLRVIDKMFQREDGRLIMSFMEDTAFQNKHRKNNVIGAVLLKSPENLQAELQSRPSNLSLRGPLWDLPIHWSAAWPEGLLQLISAGADINVCDNEGWTPLHYAIICKNAKCVDILLKAKSKLQLHPKISPLKMTLNLACSYYDQGVFQTLVDHLVYRSKQLQELAEARLPHKTLLQLQMPNDKLLEGTLAKEVEDAIVAQNIPIEPHLLQEFDFLSVYHTDSLSVNTAEHFWAAGFRDLDLPDLSYSCTPITPMWHHLRNIYCIPSMVPSMEHEFWDLMTWFYSRGASLDYYFTENVGWLKGNRMSMKSALCKELGRRIRCRKKDDTDHPRQDARNYIRKLKPQHRALISKSLTYDAVDGCECSCTFTGCLPVTSLLDALTRRPPPYRTDLRPFLMGYRGCGLLLDLILSGLGDAEEKKRIALEAVRFACFHKLELTHTCCQFRTRSESGGLDAAEIQEIHEEESETIEQLEALMQEFGAKLDLEKMSLERFFYEIWEGRMEEFFEETRVNEEGLRKAREAGVLLK